MHEPADRNPSPAQTPRAVSPRSRTLFNRISSRISTLSLRLEGPENTVRSRLRFHPDPKLTSLSTDPGLAHILAPGAYARWPLLKRLDKLDIPITFIYGDHDWMDENGGYDAVKKLRAKPVTPETARQKKLSKVVIK